VWILMAKGRIMTGRRPKLLYWPI